MRFGERLHSLRVEAEPKRLSLQALANAIGSTHQYIDAIEKNPKQGPPTFAHCVKLAKVLSLSEAETRDFLMQAFLERIDQNAEFLTHLFPNLDALNKHLDQLFTLETGSDHPCLYSVILVLNPKTPSIKKSQNIVMDGAIHQAASRRGAEAVLTDIQSKKIWVILAAPPDVAIDDLVRDIKKYTLSQLKNHDPTFSASGSFWQKAYSVKTLSSAQLKTSISELNAQPTGQKTALTV